MRAGEVAVIRLRSINQGELVVVVRSAVCSASVTACDAKVGVLVSVVAQQRHRYASLPTTSAVAAATEDTAPMSLLR